MSILYGQLLTQEISGIFFLITTSLWFSHMEACNFIRF
uniref:Uncharacterized protein n=1 Tax=Anguilla anguilla TaxID=7936 RepID=A0A0E9S8L7_ANGAN